MAGVTFWNFYFQLHPGTIKTPQVVQFLQALRRQIRRPLLIVWDWLPAHRSAAIRRRVESSQGRLATESLPAYAPELNPIEYLWAYWKQHEVTNVCPKEYWGLDTHARLALKSMKSRRKPLFVAFWKQAELRFE